MPRRKGSKGKDKEESQEWPKKTKSGNDRYPEAKESERPASAEVEQPPVTSQTTSVRRATSKGQGEAVSSEEELYKLLPGLRGTGRARSNDGRTMVMFPLNEVLNAVKSLKV